MYIECQVFKYLIIVEYYAKSEYIFIYIFVNQLMIKLFYTYFTIIKIMQTPQYFFKILEGWILYFE